MGVMGYDMKEVCKFCGAPVCLYCINFEEGIKMCSNDNCTYALSEENMEFFNLELFHTKMSAANTQSDSSQARVIAPASNSFQVSKCPKNASTPQAVSPMNDDSLSKVINFSDEKQNKESLLKLDEDKKLMEAMKRLNYTQRTPQKRTVIRDPKFLKQLKLVNRVRQFRSRTHLEPKEPQYKMNIDTDSEGGPVIKIDLTNYPQVQLTCTNDDAGSSSQVST